MKNDTTIYKNDSFTLTRTSFREGESVATAGEDGTLTMADGSTMNVGSKDLTFNPPWISSDSPILQSLYGVSLKDHDNLVIDRKTYLYMMCSQYGFSRNIPEDLMPRGPVFWAGYGFTTSLFTRDTAYSSWLGTAYILPEVVQSHLRHLHTLRRKIGYKVTINHEIPRLPDLPLEMTDMTGPEMGRKYNEGCITRRTDDVVWVLGLWEAYKSTRDESLLEYILKEFTYFDENFYHYFLDNATGLYRGQSTFIDIFGPPYEKRSPGDCVFLKALSTNCLYAQCIKIVATIAGLVGKDDEAAALRKRHENLAASIRKEFAAADYHHFLDDDGRTSGRQELLSLAFLTLFDIIPAEEGATLLANYHDGDYGRPLMWPFCGSGKVYHDNSTWPFADTIFALAEYKVGNKQDVIRKTMAKLCRHGLNGNFNEVLEWENGAFVGCPGYIWSSASYLALVYRMIAGMEVSETGEVAFAPVLPPEIGEHFDLTGIKVGEMTIDLSVRGSGENISSCTINDTPVACPTIAYTPGTHTIAVVLS